MIASTSRTTLGQCLRTSASSRAVTSTDRAISRYFSSRPSPITTNTTNDVRLRTSTKPTPRRSFFSLPDISKLTGLSSGLKDQDGVVIDGEEQKFHARKILPYSQAQLYYLVADVPSYSTFIPFCNFSRVISPASESSKRRGTREGWKPDDNPFVVDAELTVGFGGLEERYISRVVGKPFESVQATATEQIPLFKTLVSTWSFSPASSISPHPTSNSLTTPSSSSVPNTSQETRSPNSTYPRDLQQGPSLLTIDLSFAFNNPLHRIASQAVLPKVAEKMVEAFERRCVEVYGKGVA